MKTGSYFIFFISLFIQSNTIKAQYCIPSSAGSACITNVTLNTINNTTGSCGPNNYGQFSGTVLQPGFAYLLTVSTNASAVTGVWLDFNQNTFFDVSEFFIVGSSGTTASINITVPPLALLGQTALRVRSRLTGNLLNASDACSPLGSGECEDYSISIGSPTKLSTKEKSNEWFAYPNPTSSVLYISNKNATDDVEYKLYNITGQLVLRSTENSIDLSRLPRGNYLLRSETGSQIIVLE